MLLQDKNAVIYGGGGAIGGATALAFAREGAKVFLAGRSLDKLDRVAREISDAGGAAETAEVDALDERAVDDHADSVAATAGRIDIALNAVGILHVQGTPFAELTFRGLRASDHGVHADELPHREGGRPAHGEAGLGRGPDALDIRIAALGPGIPGLRRRVRRNRDVLAHPDRRARPQRHPRHLPAAACDSRNGRDLTCPRALRRLSPSPPAPPSRTGWRERTRPATRLGRLPTLAEVADYAAFVASDRAGAMTGAIANLSAGFLVD